jgi:hypothetical protein
LLLLLDNLPYKGRKPTYSRSTKYEVHMGCPLKKAFALLLSHTPSHTNDQTGLLALNSS